MNRLFVVLFLFLSNSLTRFAVGNVLVYTSNGSVFLAEYESYSALFGPSLPALGYRVLAVAGEPIDGCSALNPPPTIELDYPDSPDTKVTVNYVVIVARGGTNCTFEQKVRNAQNAGFHATIVHNVDSEDLQRMSAKNAADIHIPSVFVGSRDGNKLINEFNYMDGVYLLLNDDMPFDINTHLILPFSIVVGLCFLIMIGFMIVRCVREQRRMRRHRLPSSMLKSIPVIKFNKTLTYEMCAICLDDYQEGERLRVLPCDHAYHCKCIDEWLTKNRRVCPICKRKVLPKRPPRHGTQQNRNRLDQQQQQQQQGQRQQQQQQQQRRRQHPQQRSSDESTSDSEADDSTPLLLDPYVNSSNSQNHGTFRQVSASNVDATIHRSMLQQRVNPFDRSPNLDDSILNEQANVSAWHRFLRMFNRRRNQHNDTSQNNIDNYHNDGSNSAIINVSGSSSGSSSLNLINGRRLNTRVDGSGGGGGGGGGGTSGYGGCDNVSTISIHGVDGATGGSGGDGGVGDPSAASSSNNLLNSNLSGSFKDSDDDDLPQVSIYEPINMATTTNRATTSSSNIDNTVDSNRQNLVSTSQGKVGVAAIPNMNFQPTRPSISPSSPSSSSPRDDPFNV